MEYDLKDYTSRMVHDGKRNNREVLIYCAYCGEEAWARWQRVKKGMGRFCSREHASYWESENSKKPNREGKENAGFTWDASRKVWVAWWGENGKRKTTTKAKWVWEMDHGEVPKGFHPTYIDGDSYNCVLNNLHLVSRGEITSKALMGHSHSDEAKENMSKAHSGKTLSEEHKRNIGKASKKAWEDGVFDDPDIREKWSDATQGENNPNWKNGASFTPYPKEFKRARKKVIKRDGSLCQICHDECIGRMGHVHHINANKQNNAMENLILVCRDCHGKIHGTKKTSNMVISAFRSMLEY